MYAEMYTRITRGDYSNKLPFACDRKQIREENGRLKFLFKHDLEQAYDLKEHPKRDLLFNLAWEHGHSAGYAEVLYHYDSFSRFLR